MRLFDYVWLGLKNIWRHKARSTLTILAVVIGAISVTIMLSLVLGAERVATKQIESIGGLTLVSVSANPDVESGNLLNTDTGSTTIANKLNDTSVERLRQIPHVVDATPIAGIWIKSMKLAGQEKRFNANLVAYVPGNQVMNLPISAGRKLVTGEMDKIVLGRDLVRRFGYEGNPGGLVGQKVVLFVEGSYNGWESDPPKPPENADKEYWDKFQSAQREITAEVVGIVMSGPNDGQNFITLDWGKRLTVSKNWEWDDVKRKEWEEARKTIEEQLNRERENQKEDLFKDAQTDEERKLIEERMRNDWEDTVAERLAEQGFNNSNFQILVTRDEFQRQGYSSILVKADSTDNVASVAKAVQDMGYGSQTALDMLTEIKKIFRMVGLLIGAIGGISLFVAAIGIINTMIMATYERTREIGILRACGATRATIRKQFLFEAAMIGFWGGVLGLAASFGLARIGNMIGNSIAVSEGVPITNIISFPPWLIIGVIGLTTLIGTLAGLLPAMHAAKMDPVEALRYE